MNDNKVGLDDYLLARPKIGADEYHKLPHAELPTVAVLYGLNEEYAYLRRPKGRILRFSDGEILTDHDFCLDTNVRKVEGLTAGGKPTEHLAGHEWLIWPRRTELEQAVYEPGKPARQIVGKTFNRWPGYAVEPVKGDITPWLELLDWVFENTPPSQREWVELWIARMFQYPGELFHSAIVMIGAPGIGKSWLGELIGGVQGLNYITIDNAKLHSGFTEWAYDKEFILADEISSSDRRGEADRIKGLITRPTNDINLKGITAFSQRNSAKYYFTSNHRDALFVEDASSERRYFVPDLQQTRRLEIDNTALVERIIEWRKNGGLGHLLWHFQNYKKQKVAKFNPRAVPNTAAKEEMAAASRSDLVQFAYDLAADAYTRLASAMLGAFPNGSAKPINIDLWTSKQLVILFDPHDARHTTEKALGNALRNTGKFWRVPGRTRTKCGNERLWCLVNVAEWRRATPKERAYEYERHLNRAPKQYPAPQPTSTIVDLAEVRSRAKFGK